MPKCSARPPATESGSATPRSILEVERDFTVYGDECKFGGGKTIREGQGQAAGVGDADALDCVITNALVVDYTGIYKADIGIKNGLIAGIGKAGNPDVMAGVTNGMIVGVTTEVIAGEGLDSHRRAALTRTFILSVRNRRTRPSPPDLTTMVGGGTGPATGTCATTCTPGAFSLAHDAAGHRWSAAQFRFHRQGQHRVARRLAGANPRRRHRPEAARGLGDNTRRD